METGPAEADRAALIRACIYVRDRTTTHTVLISRGTPNVIFLRSSFARSSFARSSFSAAFGYSE